MLQETLFSNKISQSMVPKAYHNKQTRCIPTHFFSLLHLQQNFFEKVCRNASCLFIIPTTLVCVLFGPAIPTYFFNL